MAIVQLMIPEGFSTETKKALIHESKMALCEALEVPAPAAISVFAIEFKAENLCEDAGKKRVLIVFTTEGKPLSQKRRAGELFEEACRKVLGDQKGDTFIVFKEHSLANLCVRGKMRLPE